MQAMQQETIQAQEIQLRTAEQERLQAVERMTATASAAEQLQVQCDQFQAQLGEKDEKIQAMQLRCFMCCVGLLGSDLGPLYASCINPQMSGHPEAVGT